MQAIPCGTTLRAAYECGRDSYGFEVDRKFYTLAKQKMLDFSESQLTFNDAAHLSNAVDPACVLNPKSLNLSQNMAYVEEIAE